GGNPKGLNVISDGDIYIPIVSEDQTSSIIIDHVESKGGNVVIHAADGIFALDADSVIIGNRVEIYTKRGGVGAEDQVLRVDSSAEGSGGLAVKADGDIYIREVEGDLNLIEPNSFPEGVAFEASVHSVNGDVYLEAANGSIYDSYLELFRTSESVDLNDPLIRELIESGAFTEDSFKYPLSPGLYKTLYPHAEFLGASPNASAEETLNIIGDNVTLIAGGSGQIGHVSDMMSIDMTEDFENLSTEEKEALSIATAGDIIGVNYALYEYIGGGEDNVDLLSANFSDADIWRRVSVDYSTGSDSSATVLE
ncbi:MAG: hypothetical protein ACP5I1_18120, partial [Candidatus Hinthialibacter sp.]